MAAVSSLKLSFIASRISKIRCRRISSSIKLCPIVSLVGDVSGITKSTNVDVPEIADGFVTGGEVLVLEEQLIRTGKKSHTRRVRQVPSN